MNLFEVCLEVLEHADEIEMSLDDEMCRETIANEIYDLFYEYQVYSPYFDTGYMGDLKDYWEYRKDFDEDE